MSDPQNFGLGELGQRVQAMGDPAPEPRLRPYQGAPLPVGSASNGRPMPAAEPVPGSLAAGSFTTDAFRDLRATPPAQPLPPFSYSVPPIPPAQPAPAEPYGAYASSAAAATPSANGYGPLHGSHAAAGSGSEPLAGAPGSATAPVPNTPVDPNAPKTGLQRAVEAVRSALPLVQRLLPLLEGNFATAIGALMAPQPGHHSPPQQVHVDLEPVERGLAEVRTSNRELRTQIQEQSVGLKRVEDQLERVREATDRNTLEQQELVEDLRAVGSRISTFAIVGLVLLAVSLGLNVYFLVQLQHILR